MRRYLERVLSGLKDPYEVAIVTHALTLANSAAKETAFGQLHKLKRETGTFTVIHSIIRIFFNNFYNSFQTG